MLFKKVQSPYEKHVARILRIPQMFPKWPAQLHQLIHEELLGERKGRGLHHGSYQCVDVWLGKCSSNQKKNPRFNTDGRDSISARSFKRSVAIIFSGIKKKSIGRYFWSVPRNFGAYRENMIRTKFSTLFDRNNSNIWNEMKFTLTCARRLVQLDLEWLFRDEFQARKRINRIGQKKETFTYSLISKGSHPEGRKWLWTGRMVVISKTNDNLVVKNIEEENATNHDSDEESEDWDVDSALLCAENSTAYNKWRGLRSVSWW